MVEVDGEFYGVYISDRVSLAHQCQVHSPAKIGSGTLIGMQAMVFNAAIGSNCVLDPQVLVMGVTIPGGNISPVRSTITSQEAADNLPLISSNDYPLKNLNKAVIHVNINWLAATKKKK